MGPSKSREGASLLSSGKERPAGSSPWTLVLIAVSVVALLVGGGIVLAVQLTRCRPPSVASVASSCESFVAHPTNALWAHTTPPLASAATVRSIDIVVSFCSSDLSWLDSFARQIRTLSGGVVPAVIVYAKCGASTSSAQLRLTAPISHVERVLPNAGRCDHTYAYHIANHAGDGGTLADLTLFVKDTLNPARPQVRLFGDGGEPHFHAELPMDNLRTMDVWFLQLINDGFSCSCACHPGASNRRVARRMGRGGREGVRVLRLRMSFWSMRTHHSLRSNLRAAQTMPASARAAPRTGTI